MPSPLRLLAPFVFATILSATWRAHAQEPPPVANARTHYERGTSHYDAGRFADAIVEYRRAYELEADPAYLFNIAQSYRQLGVRDRAIFFYRRYLSTAPNAVNHLQVEQQVAELEALERESAEAARLTAPAPAPVPPAPAIVVTPAPPPPTPLHLRWWVWTGAALVVSAAIAVPLALAGRGNQAPSTDLGNQRYP